MYSKKRSQKHFLMGLRRTILKSCYLRAHWLRRGYDESNRKRYIRPFRPFSKAAPQVRAANGPYVLCTADTSRPRIDTQVFAATYQAEKWLRNWCAARVRGKDNHFGTAHVEATQHDLGDATNGAPGDASSSPLSWCCSSPCSTASSATGFVLAAQSTITQAAADGARKASYLPRRVPAPPPRHESGESRHRLDEQGRLWSFQPRSSHAWRRRSGSSSATNTCLSVTVTYNYASSPLFPELPGFGVIMPSSLSSTNVLQL